MSGNVNCLLDCTAIPSGKTYRVGRFDTRLTGCPSAFEVIAEGHAGVISDGTGSLYVSNCIEP